MSPQSLISVVDDDISVRESLQSLLKSLGFAVKLFASAEEFLQSDDLRDTDCLILDVRMPGMSGIELHRYLVANHSEVPVVFITAHGFEQETRLRVMRDGAVDYLRKPFSADALLNAVRKALG